MSAAEVQVHRNGEIEADENAKASLAAHHGAYSLLPAGGLLLLRPKNAEPADEQPEGDEVALAGDISAMPLLSLLNFLGQGNETGRLVVRRASSECIITLRDGDIATVASNAERDRLGQFLLRLGKIKPSQLEEAIAESKGGVRLGRYLVKKEYLDAHDLWSAIREQVTEIFAGVVDWRDGNFVFCRLPEGTPVPSNPPLSMQGLLLEAVRRSDEMGRFRNLIPNDETWVRRTAKAAAEKPAKLDTTESTIFEHISEAKQLLTICRETQTNEFESTRAVYGLIQMGLLEIVAPGGFLTSPFSLSENHRGEIEVYNLAFSEIHDEIFRNGHSEPFSQSVDKYFSKSDSPYAAVFVDVQLDDTGALPADILEKNLNAAKPEDPFRFLSEALNELTFFMLFQCGELLDSADDEHLGRRVRLIHSALESAAE